MFSAISELFEYLAKVFFTILVSAEIYLRAKYYFEEESVYVEDFVKYEHKSSFNAILPDNATFIYLI